MVVRCAALRAAGDVRVERIPDPVRGEGAACPSRLATGCRPTNAASSAISTATATRRSRLPRQDHRPTGCCSLRQANALASCPSTTAEKALSTPSVGSFGAPQRAFRPCQGRPVARDADRMTRLGRLGDRG